MLSCRPVIMLLFYGAVSGQKLWGQHRFSVSHRNDSRNENDPLTYLLMAYWTSKKPLRRQVNHVDLDPVVVGHYPPKLFSFDDVRYNEKCLPCPKDKVVVAKRKSLTAAFVPPLVSSPCINEADEGERLLVHINGGPRQGTQLRAGRYPIYLTLIDHTKSPPYRATQCDYTYEVIVNKCEPLEVEGQNVHVACTHENAWGSICTFSCASGFKRRGFAKTVCQNDLSWNHKPPKCTRKKSKGDCKMTAFYGSFQCGGGDQITSVEHVGPGTVCDLSCFDGYFIPTNQRHLATIKCVNGRWNSTEDPLCLPIPTTPSPVRTTPRRINMSKRKYPKKENIKRYRLPPKNKNLKRYQLPQKTWRSNT